MTGEITLAWDQVTEFPCPGLKQMKKKINTRQKGMSFNPPSSVAFPT